MRGLRSICLATLTIGLLGCGSTSVAPVVADPSVPTICDIGFFSMSEPSFLAMTEGEQRRLLEIQAVWLNACLSPGQTPPPSLD